MVGVGGFAGGEGAALVLELGYGGQACPDGKFLAGGGREPGAAGYPGVLGGGGDFRVQVGGKGKRALFGTAIRLR